MISYENRCISGTRCGVELLINSDLLVTMANQAAKKAQRASVELKTKLQYWIVPINVVYILYRLIWLNASVTTWTLVGHAFLVGVTYLSFKWVVGAAEEGGSSEYAMDVLIITLFTQSGLLISDYFWFAFLAIPGYLLYLGSGMLKNYIFTPTAAEQEVDDPAAQKKKEKAERRASRPKFKAGR